MALVTNVIKLEHNVECAWAMASAISPVLSISERYMHLRHILIDRRGLTL